MRHAFLRARMIFSKANYFRYILLELTFTFYICIGCILMIVFARFPSAKVLMTSTVVVSFIIAMVICAVMHLLHCNNVAFIQSHVNILKLGGQKMH